MYSHPERRPRLPTIACFAVALLAQTPRADAQQPAPPPANAAYRNPSLPVADRVRDLVGRMTIEEKFWQLFMTPGDLDTPTNDYSNGSFGLQISAAARGTGTLGASTPQGNLARAHADRINAIQHYFVDKTRLGIPILPFEEAVHGLKDAGATIFPQAIALAATWDTAMMRRVSTAIAHEAGSRGVRDVLSPVINIATDVRWGRVEETYGEDPYLTSEMAVAFVGPFQRAGIITTPKHFVANVGDGGRDSYPIQLSDRALTEIHYPPFLAAIKRGGSQSVMVAYNSVDGAPATQNHALMDDLLKRDWGFTGFVISDASAVGGATVLHHTEASSATATKDAFESGLDVVFQSSYDQNRPYLDAFRRGLIADSIINASVSRVLRAKFEMGLFEHPFANADSAAYWKSAATADHLTLALDAARASIVLLKNDHGALPLPRTLKVIAVIGQDASEARLGGYSAPPTTTTSIVDGIRAKLGTTARVRFATGPGRITPDYVTVPATQLSSIANGQTVRGLQGEYFDNNRLEGTPRLVRTDMRLDFGWTLNAPGRGIPYDWYSVRWTGKLLVPPGGVHRLGIEGNDGYRLYLDGKLIVDDWEKRSYTTTFANDALAAGTSL